MSNWYNVEAGDRGLCRRSRDKNFNRAIDGWNQPFDQTNPCGRKRRRDDTRLDVSSPDAGGRHRRELPIKGYSARQRIEPCARNLHDSGRNAGTETNGRYTTIYKANSDSRKYRRRDCETDEEKAADFQKRGDGTIMGESDSWDAARKRTIEYRDVKKDTSLKQERRDNDVCTHDRTDTDLWKPGRRYGNANRVSDNWSSYPRKRHWREANDNIANRNVSVHKQNSGRGAWKQQSIDAKTETDGWGGSVKKACVDASEAKLRNGNSSREHDGWGIDSKKPLFDVNIGDRNVRKEIIGWGAVSKKGSNRKVDTNTKETNGWGSWESNNKDGSVTKATVGWGAVSKNGGSDPWEGNSKVDTNTKETNEWGSWECKDGIVTEETNIWGAVSKKDGSDPWESNNKVDTITKETGGWGSWESNNKDGSVSKVTVGWGAISEKGGTGPWESNNKADTITKKADELGAWESVNKDGTITKETVGFGAVSKKGGTDPWESKSKVDSNTIETNGWGSWESNKKDGNVTKETEGWGGSSKNDGWGAVLDPSRSSAWGAHNSGGNGKREVDDWNKSQHRKRSRSPPPGFKRTYSSCDHRGSGGVCKDFLAGRCTRGSQCRYFHDHNVSNHFKGDPSIVNKDGSVSKVTVGWGAISEKGGTGPWESNNKADTITKKTDVLGACENVNKDGTITKETVGFGAVSKTGVTDPWESKSKVDSSTKETNGWDSWESNKKDGNVTKETEGWGGSPKNDGWGAVLDRSRSSAWGAHNSVGNGKKEVDDWNKSQHGKRSRSPPPEFKRTYSSCDHRGSDGVCRDFLVGRCTRGSQCRYFHGDSVSNHLKGDPSIMNGNNTKDLIQSWDNRISQRRRGPCYDFAKGRCQRGSACRFVHHDNDVMIKSVNDCSSWDGPKCDDQAAITKAPEPIERDADRGKISKGDHQTVNNIKPSDPMEMNIDITEILNNISFDYSRLMKDVEASTIKPQPVKSQEGSSSKPQPEPSCVIPSAIIQSCQDDSADSKMIIKSSALSAIGPLDVHPTKKPDLQEEQHLRDREAEPSAATNVVRRFKFALADFVKEILKPSWEEGGIGKEAYKIVVKKVVDKVVSVLQGPNIPHTQERIQIYLSYSKTKISKLVQDYLRRHARRTDQGVEKA